MFFSSNFVVFTLVLFCGVVIRTHCSVLDRSESEPEQLPSSISSSALPVPDTIAEASEPTETTVSVVLSPPPFVPSSATTAVTASAPIVPPTNSATNNKAKANITSVIIPKPKPIVNKVIQINNQTKSEKLPESKNITVISTGTGATATGAQQVPSISTVSVTDLQQLEKEKEKHRHDSKVMEIIQMGLTSLRHAGDRLKKFVSKIEAGIKSGALNETIESVKVKIEKGEIDLKKIIHAYKQKSTVGLEQLIKRISDDSHTLLDKLHGRVDATGVHIKEIPRETSDESAEAHHHHHPHHPHHPHHQQQEQQQQQHSHPKDANVTVVQEEAASETVSIYAPVPTETEFTA